MANPELDAHFERLHKLLSSMRAPEIHVHVHTNADVPRKRRRDLSIDEQRTAQGTASEGRAAPHPYVS